MLSVVLRRSMPKFAAAPKKFAFRAFSEKLSIPIDVEQQHGRRKEEMDAEAAGEVGFERDPIVPPDNAGTKENPILVSLFWIFYIIALNDAEIKYFIWDFILSLLLLLF